VNITTLISRSVFGANIIDNFITYSFNANIMTANSIVDMSTNINPAINLVIDVLGYFNPGDNGGGSFYWDDSSVETANNGTIFISNLSLTGRWKRIYSSEINVRWFGAKGDGGDDSPSFNAAIDTGLNIFVPEGSYSVSGLSLHWNQSIYGESTLSELHANQTNQPLLTISRFGRVRELTLYSQQYVLNENFIAINVLDQGNTVICDALRIVGGFTNAIKLSDSNNVVISNCYISGMMACQIQIQGGTHNIIENNYLEKCSGTSFIKLVNAPSVTIKNNYIAGGNQDRPQGQGIYAESNVSGYNYAVINLESNDIDNIGGQAIVIVGYYSIRIKGNWLSAGRTAGVSSIFLAGCKRVEISGNDIYTSGYMGLQITDCEVGAITNNQIEQWEDTGIFMLRCRQFSIIANQIGNLTGLDPDGYIMKVGLSENQGDYNIISNNIFNGNTITNLYYEGSHNIVNNNILM
jgi:hypothetical protein